MTTILNVPRKIEPTGHMRVRERRDQIHALIDSARAGHRTLITVTRIDGKVTRPFDVKWALINGIEEGR